MAQKNRRLDVNMLADEVISARPGDAIPWMMLGNHYITVRQLDKAEDCFEKAAALDPLRPGIWSKLAFIALWQNRKNDAEKLMEKAQQIFPKNPRYNVQKFLSGGEK